MKEKKREGEVDAPNVSEAQVAQLKARLAASDRQPIHPIGYATKCQTCGGRMTTTNDLERTVAAPGLVYVVARLPGAKCLDCGSTELDGSGVAILETAAPRGIWADYETTVTHSSGSTLGMYFKMDLARVLSLSGNERLLWQVVDRNSALVRVERRSSLRRDHSRRLTSEDGRRTVQRRRRTPVETTP